MADRIIKVRGGNKYVSNALSEGMLNKDDKSPVFSAQVKLMVNKELAFFFLPFEECFVNVSTRGVSPFVLHHSFKHQELSPHL